MLLASAQSPHKRLGSVSPMDMAPHARQDPPPNASIILIDDGAVRVCMRCYLRIDILGLTKEVRTDLMSDLGLQASKRGKGRLN
jgi:hypothetical protein